MDARTRGGLMNERRPQANEKAPTPEPPEPVADRAGDGLTARPSPPTGGMQPPGGGLRIASITPKRIADRFRFFMAGRLT